jgi:hypothetical protein
MPQPMMRRSFPAATILVAVLTVVYGLATPRLSHGQDTP